MGGFGDWINPAKSLPAMFSKKTAFGLNPLNVGGKADPDRDQMTAPGTTLKKDALDAKTKLERENAQAIADAKAAESTAAAQAQAAIDKKLRSKARSQSVYTSPLGLTTEASTTRKTLTGQ